MDQSKYLGTVESLDSFAGRNYTNRSTIPRIFGIDDRKGRILRHLQGPFSEQQVKEKLNTIDHTGSLYESYRKDVLLRDVLNDGNTAPSTKSFVKLWKSISPDQYDKSLISQLSKKEFQSYMGQLLEYNKKYPLPGYILEDIVEQILTNPLFSGSSMYLGDDLKFNTIRPMYGRMSQSPYAVQDIADSFIALYKDSKELAEFQTQRSILTQG